MAVVGAPNITLSVPLKEKYAALAELRALCIDERDWIGWQSKVKPENPPPHPPHSSAATPPLQDEAGREGGSEGGDSGGSVI